MTDSPARSSLGASIATLPSQSPNEPLYNCTTSGGKRFRIRLHLTNPFLPTGTLELIIEPLNAIQASNSGHLSHQGDSKSKKNAKTSGSKSPSPASSPKPSSPAPESPELEQSREWCASASQNAKSQPDLAYKMFARAGQTFVRHFRTKEAAQCYFSVVQLQNGILKSKILELSHSYLNSTPSFLEVAINDPGISESSQQIVTSLSVLFKSYLYLARIFRPHDAAISLRMFWNCLECIIPSQFWTIMEKLTWNDSIAASPATALLSPHPLNRSGRDQLTQYCGQIVARLKPSLAFVDLQRTKAGQTLTLSAEVALIARELAGFLCAREPSALGICLYEVALTLSQSEDSTDAGVDAQIVLNEKKDLLRQATLFGGLKLSHWQFDCIIEASTLCDVTEREALWCKAVAIAINLSTFRCRASFGTGFSRIFSCFWRAHL